MPGRVLPCFFMPIFNCDMKNSLLICLFYFGSIISIIAQVTHIKGPAGSGVFGQSVVCFPNGNFAVNDPLYDENGKSDIGAVYIYDGKTQEIIAVLKGVTPGDRIGNYIYLLNDNLLLVYSPLWDSGKGALTVMGNKVNNPIEVKESNSLVGQNPGDLSSIFTQIIPDKGYVINVPSWGNNKGAVLTSKFQDPLTGFINSENAFTGTYAGDRVGQAVMVLQEKVVIASSTYNQKRGAVTVRDWNSCQGEFSHSNALVGERAGDQVGLMINPLNSQEAVIVNSFLWNNERGAVTNINTGNPLTGYISPDNSLTGGKNSDKVGFNGVYALKNNNYVVVSTHWNQDRGAVTWGEGTKGVVGVVDSENSVVGTQPNDRIGLRFAVLSNGNFVTHSEAWNNATGSVTWGDGRRGIYGEVNATNSLIGTQANDHFGNQIKTLENGDYLVINWGIPAIQGSFTWGDGNGGTVGKVSEENSLVGISTHAYLTPLNLVQLTNGNVVVNFPYWNNGRGAVIFMASGKRVVGKISAENSLTGANDFDRIGLGGVIPLTNGNYVFSSPEWAQNTGAITWGDGNKGIIGLVSEKNSMTGIKVKNIDNNLGLYALSNGNYVAHTTYYDAEIDRVIWGNGTTGTIGEVNESNSLKGDNIRIINITPLKNGNYVINSAHKLLKFNAITWANGNIPLKGEISEANSFIGEYDGVGLGTLNSPIKELSTGDYIIHNPFAHKGKGVVAWASGTEGLSGLPTDKNSILGNSFDDGQKLIPVFNYPLNYLMVGRPHENMISLLNPNFELVTGLEEVDKKEKKTNIYPNPGKDLVYLKSETLISGDISVKVLDTQGRLLQFQSETISSSIPMQINIQNLPEGVYILDINGRGFSERQKLIKH